MTQRAFPQTTKTAQISTYDEMPLSQILFRYLWPFWLFRNASSGDRYARAAAYRHNRSMRIYLPGYLVKWLCNCAFAFALIVMFDSNSAHASSLSSVMAAGAGVMFACGVAIVFVTGYIYLYLSRNGE
jgi:hypothetical protein